MYDKKWVYIKRWHLFITVLVVYECHVMGLN